MVAFPPETSSKLHLPAQHDHTGYTFILRHTTLLAGLILTVLVAVVPAFLVLLRAQDEMVGGRIRQARTLALTDAQLAEATVGSVLSGLNQAMRALSASRQVQDGGEECDALLDSVRRQNGLPVLAVAGADGGLLCGAAARMPADPAAFAALARPLLGAAGFTTGVYMGETVLGPPMIGLALPFIATGSRRAFVVAGLPVRDLQRALKTVQPRAGGTLAVADRDGTVLTSDPPDPAATGTKLDQALMPLLLAPMRDTKVFDDLFDEQTLIGFVPPGGDPARLFVVTSNSVAGLVANIDRSSRRNYALLAVTAVLSLALALWFGHWQLRMPAAVLLEAARRWGSGDLMARARMPGAAPAELASIGRAFNEMAEQQQQQRAELKTLNDRLEGRVAERTRALLESNNRLQVAVAEQELAEAVLRRAQRMQSVGQLAGGLARHFDTLLATVLACLDRIRAQVPADAPNGPVLDEATGAVSRGMRLSAHLLALSGGKSPLAVSVDVAETIAGMTELLAGTAGPDVRVELRLNEGLWPIVTDPNEFEAAIVNLVLNGREAMPEGGRLTVMAANRSLSAPAGDEAELAPGDYVAITVADSGCGMTAEVASRALEPFFTTKGERGLGLGLPRVHRLASQAGGGVVIRSRPSDGTRVSLLLPRAAAARKAAEALALPPGKAILLVDDDAAVRETTAAVLTDAGYDVVQAPGGTEALAALAAGDAVGLVVTDFRMPGMDGVELLRAVRRQHPAMPVLLATGYADALDLTGPGLSTHQVIRKPYRSNELLARLHVAVGMAAERAAPPTDDTAFKGKRDETL